MPLYQYECEKCGERFDVRQKFVDAPLTVHEVCGGALHRLISAPALQFKGSGFYITDYAKNSTSNPGNGGTKKSESSSSDSEKSSGEKSSGEKSSSDSKATTPAAAESKPVSSSSDTK